MQGAMKIRNEPKAMPVVVPVEGIKVLADGNATPLSAGEETFQKIWIYPAKAVVGGELTANANAIKIGLSNTYLRDARAATDTDYPVIYEMPLGMRMPLKSVHIKGTATDGAFYSYV